MRTCAHCGTAGPDDARICPQCGRAYPFSARGDTAEATQRWSWQGGPPRKIPVDVFTSQSGQLHRTIAVGELFAYKTRLTIGRSPQCDICLPHPSVSRIHAELEKLPSGIRIRDLGSVNGLMVGGRRIEQTALLREQERVGIGPFLFCLSQGVIHALDSSRSLRLEARHLEKLVPSPEGGRCQLLSDINLAVEPGEFVSLLGPSGSGKSTLLDCLNGRRPASGGQVLANGEDFYRHFSSFRQLLGYVPQRDIVHTHLTVYRALYYTARLRLPTDTEPAELEARIGEVIRLMELEAHADTLVANLSGGQIKRVSLGAELLARPCLLYIDEATSGLDAGTEARMMRLFRQLSDEGRSVICITHNVDHVDLCHLLLVLARGRLIFFGPPAEARTYFGVSRLGAIYDRIAEKAPEEWEQAFRQSSLHAEFVARRLERTPEGSVILGPPSPEAVEAWKRGDKGKSSLSNSAIFAAAQEPPHRQLGHQFLVLVRRYAELIWRDHRSLRLLLFQAPVVALFLLLGFVGKPYQEKILAPRLLTEPEREALTRWVRRLETLDQQAQITLPELRKMLEADPDLAAIEPLTELLTWPHDRIADWVNKAHAVLDARGPVVPDRLIVNPRFTYMLLFLMVITVLWFGCNNAAKEIVKEEAIYARERAVNLGISPYLASKFLVLTVITALQSLMLMLVIYGVFDGLHAVLGTDVPAPVYRLGYLPQMGIYVLLSAAGVALGLFLSACVSSPDRATTLLPYVLIPQIILGGGIMNIQDGLLHILAVLGSPAYWAYRAVRTGEADLPPGFPYRMDYQDHLPVACLALVLQALVLLLLGAWAMRLKDVRTR